MMTDPFDAYKRDAEDADRTAELAKEARYILGRMYPHWREDWDSAADELREHGFSRPDAYHILEFIDWEDSLADQS